MEDEKTMLKPLSVKKAVDKKTPVNSALEQRKESAKRVQEDIRKAGLVRDEMARVAVKVTGVNMTISGLMRNLDAFSAEVERKGRGLENYPVLNSRVVAVRRLVVATKLGLERSLLRYYEADIGGAVRQAMQSTEEKRK